MWGIGKTTAIKFLQKGHMLKKLVMNKVTLVLLSMKPASLLSHAVGVMKTHYQEWLAKTGQRKVARMPALKSLPSITEAFIENVKCAHLQVCIWKQVMEPNPPNLDPNLYGWQKGEQSRSLFPCNNPYKYQISSRRYSAYDSMRVLW